MLLPESSTNTGNEVFTEPRGLNKLLWKVREDRERTREGGGEAEGVRDEMASLLVRAGRKREWDLLLF